MSKSEKNASVQNVVSENFVFSVNINIRRGKKVVSTKKLARVLQDMLANELSTIIGADMQHGDNLVGVKVSAAKVTPVIKKTVEKGEFVTPNVAPEDLQIQLETV